ncbi:MAG: hypothetical protein CMC18_03710 [Flavobacteriaceae bacterium]|nr:hypothetical protein [Flavobacteriaceae bacterium]
MRKIVPLLIFVFLASCSSEEQIEGDMQLTIVNTHPSWKILSVSLQDYSFEDFEINEGGSRAFTLYNGIPSGGLDIGVRIIYDGCMIENKNEIVRADFVDGKNTIITIIEDRTGKEDWQVNCNYTTTVDLE